MQEEQPTGGGVVDPRLLGPERRHAMKRRAVAFAHEERARVRAEAVRWVWSAIAWAARRAVLAAAAAKPAPRV
jgi:hypothetical protein